MRDKVSKALKKLDKPLIVVLDDIDRLSTPEIRDIFKLVRLTASFPNIIYILAFDRVRVEQALGEQGISGRDYLEKILQLVADLPVIPDHVLTSQIESSLEDALEGISYPGPFNADEWPDILLDIVRPLIRNMRDVRRYALAVHGTVAALGGQVSQGDVFALKAVRLFMPDVFHQLYSMRDALTTQSRRFMPEQLRPQLDMLLAHDKERQAVVTNLLRLIFPYGYGYSRGTSYSTDDIAVWQRDRRVADDTCFDLYFERVPSDGTVALVNAERAVQLFSDSDRLEEFLRSLRQKELQDALASIDAVVKSFPVEQAHAVSVVLLNMLPSAMEGELLAGLRITSKNHVARIVARFLLAVTNGTDREPLLRRVLHDVRTLSAKLEVMTLCRSRNEKLADWLPEATAVALDAQWRAEVREMLQDAEYDWKREYALLRVLNVAKRFASANEPVLHIPASATFTYALLLSARGESSTSTLDRRSSKRTPTLAWDLLVELYGDEALLRQRIGELDGMQTDDRAGVIGLAQSYVDGNAPEMRDE